jgi:hypothetical protein
MRGFFSSIVIVLMLLFPLVSRGAMTVRDFTPARHDRFYAGSGKAFVGEPYDFSGVGMGNSGHWATLVSDNCFLSAYHRRPSVGEKVTFWASNELSGPSYTYMVTGGTRVGTTDIWVGWFDRAVIVDESIARYSVPLLRSAKGYIGLVLYNYGMTHRVGRNVLDKLAMDTIGGSTGLTAWYDYNNNHVPSVGDDETYQQSGDSGAPSFAVFNSRLALIGIHWAITRYPYSSTDTFIPEYFDEINKVLKERGQSLRRSGIRGRAHSGTYW